MLIALEGVEGAGKTLHAGILNDYLRDQGYQTILLKEPSEFLRGVIKDQSKSSSSAEVDALLFAADRLKQFGEVIRPSLNEGKIVLLDRSVFSSFAYQAAQGVGLDWLEKINERMPLPDLVIVLDVDPRVGLKRIVERNEISNFDKIVNNISLQQVVRLQYFLLADRYKNRMVIINVGGKGIEETQTLIRKVVFAALERRAIIPTSEAALKSTPLL